MSNPVDARKKKRGRKSNFEKQFGPIPDYILEAYPSALMQKMIVAQESSEKALKEILAEYRVSPTISINLAIAMAEIGDTELLTPESEARTAKEYADKIESAKEAAHRGRQRKREIYKERVVQVISEDPSLIPQVKSRAITVNRAADISLILDSEHRRKSKSASSPLAQSAVRKHLSRIRDGS